jgi:hypothetical protein
MRKKAWQMVMRAGPLILLLLAVTGMNAFAFLGFGNSASWKEEVLLHDGKKIIVERSQTHGGSHNIGQPVPIKYLSVTFSSPASGKTIIWKDEYSEDVGGVNFNVLALHILNSIPYIVASPTACLEYNKWGRPNPPYVIFKYNGKEWQRIPLSDLPTEFKEINLVINSYADEKELLDKGLVSAEMIKELNSSLKQPEYKSIIRTQLEQKDNCGEYIYDGHGGWIGIGFFKKWHSYEDCLKQCSQSNVNPEYCPCGRLFKGEK